MNLTYTIDKTANIVNVVYTGHPEFVEWAEMMYNVFRDPDFKAGFSFLLDRRGVKTPPSTGYIERVVAFSRQHRKELGKSKIATVVGEPGSYGMARMFQGLTPENRSLRVFTDIDEARRWLTG